MLFTLRERVIFVNMEKDQIIQQVIQNLEEKLNLELKWTVQGPLDGILTIGNHNNILRYHVEVKGEIRQNALYKLQHDMVQYGDVMLFAEIIYPNQRVQLQKEKIAYADTNGNVFIRKHNWFIHIEVPKPKGTRKKRGNRAFTPTGLKVVFQLLLHIDLINGTQRDIAESAGVALGNIPKVMAGLMDIGYLVKLGKNTYAWTDREGLLQRWGIDYQARLVPKIHIGRFKLKDYWKNLKLNQAKTAWGGEAAGELLTNHIRAQNLILYTTEPQRTLIKNYRLVPDVNGEVEVRQMFWRKQAQTATVPPLLAYIDLILSNSKRCQDTAGMIFEQYLKNEF